MKVNAQLFHSAPAPAPACASTDTLYENDENVSMQVLQLSFSETRRTQPKRALRLLFSVDCSSSMLEQCNQWDFATDNDETREEGGDERGEGDGEVNEEETLPHGRGCAKMQKSKIQQVCDTLCAVMRWLHSVPLSEQTIYIAIQTFHSDVSMLMDCKMVPFQSQSLAEWETAVRSLASQTKGLTNMEQVLYAAGAYLNCRAHDSADAFHLLLTDGEITEGNQRVAYLTNLLGTHNHIFIGYGVEHDCHLLSMLALALPTHVEYRCVTDETDVSGLHGELVHNLLDRVPCSVLLRDPTAFNADTNTGMGMGVDSNRRILFYNHTTNKWETDLVLRRLVMEKPVQVYIRINEPISSPSPVVRIAGSAFSAIELGLHSSTEMSASEMAVHHLRLHTMQCLYELQEYYIQVKEEERKRDEEECMDETMMLTPCPRAYRQRQWMRGIANADAYADLDLMNGIAEETQAEQQTINETPPRSVWRAQIKEEHEARLRYQEEEVKRREQLDLREEVFQQRLDTLKAKLEKIVASVTPTPTPTQTLSVAEMLLEDVKIALLSLKMKRDDAQRRMGQMFVSARRWSQGRQDAHQGATMQCVQRYANTVDNMGTVPYNAHPPHGTVRRQQRDTSFTPYSTPYIQQTMQYVMHHSASL